MNNFSAFDKKLIEFPSSRLRLRAMCNEIKKLYLTDEFDPCLEQKKQLFMEVDNEFFDDRTFDNWWLGKKDIGDSSKKVIVTLFEKKKKDPNLALGWLNTSQYSTPLSRHLYAIDAGCFDCIKPGKFEKEELLRTERFIKAIDNVWSVITSDRYKTTSDVFDIFQQSQGIELVKVESDDIYNPNLFNIPPEIREVYEQSIPIKIFIFLHKYMENIFKTSELSSVPNLKDLWILDMASLSFVLQKWTYKNAAKNIRPQPIQDIHSLYKFIFFSSEQEFYNGGVKFTSEKSFEGKKLTFIRKRYHELISSIGITIDDLRIIYAPDSKNKF